jgi:transcriptional regulator with XRE-family HTH domain
VVKYHFKDYFATFTLWIANNIKKFRELKNMTREEMASNLDMSVSNYSKIEREETDLTISRIQKIADVLNVRLSQILNFDPNHIFNISHIDLSQGLGAKAENMYFNSKDEYVEKYIKILETENERLRKLYEND